MYILCLGSEYFHGAFAKLGHKVIAPPHQDGFPLAHFFDRLTDRPDLVLYTDHLGRHAWPEGLEELEIPKIYYAVDTPINFWWQKHFGALFDICYADQKPFAARFQDEGLDGRWLPVAVNAAAYQSGEAGGKIYDFGFVGVLNDQVRGKRSQLIQSLSSRFRLKTLGARGPGWVGPDESAALYSQSRLILNENLFPGVTTRMFEAMASGAPLFTEKAGGDLGEIFQPGEDFAWFEPQELFAAADYWLADEDRLAKMAARARAKVLGAHDIGHRAEKVLRDAENLNLSQGRKGQEAWDSLGRSLFLTALRWPVENGQGRLLRAEELLSRAEKNGVLSPEGRFMLGHINRLKGEVDQARRRLQEALEEGCLKAGLALGVLALGQNRAGEAAEWFARFTGLGADFPALMDSRVTVEALKALGDRQMELGEVIVPGFSFMPHDPALWQAFEFYLAAHRGRPDHLEVGRALSGLLLNSGAPAEARDVAGTVLEHHPGDETLSLIYSRAAVDSYINLN
ncbi:MAG: glycosyltransferase [Deltaproteobacteria bacterium]|nr:glycosyltransferase [Deltaproteobacteria bacterium]